MVRIIGKYICTVFSIVSAVCIVAGDISMRMINQEDHSPLSQAVVGQPFVIEVMVTDIARVGQYPVIKGLDRNAKNIGINIRTVNGRTTACYSYEVRIDTPGTYHIGPAELRDGAQVLQSNILNVVVGEHAIESARDTKNNDKHKTRVFMRLATDKQKAFVGERVTCSLRFYTSHDNAIQQLFEQEMPTLVRKQMKGPFEDTERIDGTDYRYAEWVWDVYPQKEGKLVIPAYGADYEVQTKRDNQWGGLGRFFGSRVEVKRLYSNSVTLDIMPLPAHKKPIEAIGSFSSMRVIANPTVAKQGEGMTVTVEIEGDGDSDAIKCPTLRGLPDSFKWYESKKNVTAQDSDGHCTITSFEFVVQGLQQGSWQIPPQEFHYFDVGHHAYRTLKSAPLTITIMPGAPTKQASLSHPAGHDQLREQESIASLHPIISEDICSEFLIAWWLVLLLTLLPVAIACIYAVYVFGVWIYTKRSVKKKSHRAFSHALTVLKAARRNNKTQNIYAILVESIAERCKISAAQVTKEFIDSQLYAKDISPELYAEWNVFFDKASQAAYSDSVAQNVQLFNEAEQWLKRFSHYFPAR